MVLEQKTLFDELNEVVKKYHPIVRPSISRNDDFIPSEEGIVFMFPCGIARRLPVENRPEHIRHCDTCKRLEKEMDEKVGAIGRGVWYE